MVGLGRRKEGEEGKEREDEGEEGCSTSIGGGGGFYLLTKILWLT